MTQLQPLLGLGLGWVGLLFGLQLDRESLRRFKRKTHVWALGQAVLSFTFFLAVAWIVFAATRFWDEPTMLLLVGAAATACVTTPAGIAMVSANFGVRGDVAKLLFFTGSVNAIVGIAALQAAYALHAAINPLPGFGAWGVLFSFGLALGLGTVCGIIFLWLMRLRPASEELVLFLLGICALAAGAALQLTVSPLFVCATMGVLVANLTNESRRVFELLQNWEKPVYLILLMLAGALLTLPTAWMIPLALAYALLRGAAKVSAGAVLVEVVSLPFQVPRRVGLGLVPQGGISLAMAVSLLITFPQPSPASADGAEPGLRSRGSGRRSLRASSAHCSPRPFCDTPARSRRTSSARSRRETTSSPKKRRFGTRRLHGPGRPIAIPADKASGPDSALVEGEHLARDPVRRLSSTHDLIDASEEPDPHTSGDGHRRHGPRS